MEQKSPFKKVMEPTRNESVTDRQKDGRTDRLTEAIPKIPFPLCGRGLKTYITKYIFISEIKHMKKYCWLLLPSENNSYIRIHRL
jgi:hypothetical protein